MGSSHSQFAPGIVFALSGAFCATRGFDALYRRVTCEGEVRKRALDVFPAMRFRVSMRRRPVRAQAQEGGIMMAVGGLS